jgi:hypothetical protein
VYRAEKEMMRMAGRYTEDLAALLDLAYLALDVKVILTPPCIFH